MVSLESPVIGKTYIDLNAASLASYRGHVMAGNADFPGNACDDALFCEYAGIMREGNLTYAGLLAFGDFPLIHRYVGNFWIQYAETDSSGRTFRLGSHKNIWDSYMSIMGRLSIHPEWGLPMRWAFLRREVVRALSSTDYFSPMHPVFRVDDRYLVIRYPGCWSADFSRWSAVDTFFLHCGLSGNMGAGRDIFHLVRETNPLFTKITISLP